MLKKIFTLKFIELLKKISIDDPILFDMCPYSDPCPIFRCPWEEEGICSVWFPDSKKFQDTESVYNKTLAEAYPELAKEWHPTKNGDLTPVDIPVKSRKKVWWINYMDDYKNRRRYVSEWKKSVRDRAFPQECPLTPANGFNVAHFYSVPLEEETDTVKND